MQIICYTEDVELQNWVGAVKRRGEEDVQPLTNKVPVQL